MARKSKKTRRGNGCGTLEKRNGLYVARWTVDGVRYSHTTGTTIRAEAEKKLVEFVKPFQEKSKIARFMNLETKIGLVKKEIEAEESSKPALRMDEAFEAYIKSPNIGRLSAGSEKCYANMFNRLMRFIKGYRKVKVVEMRQFTYKMAFDFMAGLKQTTEIATYNHYLVFLKRFWNVLAEESKAEKNPWERFKKDKGHSHGRKNLTIDEVRKVVASVSGEMRILMFLGYYTALRIGDCSQIKGENILLDEGVISITPHKTNRCSPEPLTIEIHPDLAKELKGHLPPNPKDYVLPECARSYQSGTLNYHVKRIFEKCGIVTDEMGEYGRRRSVKSFHSYRSGYVTMAANGGVSFVELSKRTGHKSAEVCQSYYRKSQEKNTKILNAIQAIDGNNVVTKKTLVLDSDALDALNSARCGTETIEDCIRRLVKLSVTTAMAAFVADSAAKDVKLLQYAEAS